MSPKIPIFGTSGIRRVFSNYDNTEIMLTPQMALDVGLALGTYLTSEATVVIGKDIRMSALPIEYALISGIISTGCNVKTVGIVTTPTLAVSLQFLNADAGVMITASHNAPRYIGLKFWNPSGMGYIGEQEDDIERIYNEKDFIKIEWDGVGKVTTIDDINDIHIKDVINHVMFDGSSLNVIVDPGNGASCEIVPKLLHIYNCSMFIINGNMDGSFPGRPSEPSKENLTQLSKYINISEKGEIGIALDGDADRVVFIDEGGDIVDPIRLLALMAVDYLNRNKEKIPKENRIVTTAVNSSRLLADALKPFDCKVIYTEVGDIKVAQALKEHNGFLGGETSGTYIWPSTHLGPDSIATIAKVLRMKAETGKELRELLKDIPEYPYYSSNFKLKKDIPFTDEINQKIIDEIQELLGSQGKKLENINKMDGVRFDFNDGWILIRRSGTSPYLRISGESSVDLESTKKINELAKERMEKLNLIFL